MIENETPLNKLVIVFASFICSVEYIIWPLVTEERIVFYISNIVISVILFS